MPLFPMILRTLTISLLLSPVVLFGLIADVHLSAAQIAPSRKDEADRLLEQGRQQYFNRQHEAAEQSWKKSLAVYRAIRNQNGEAWALEYLGLNYFGLSQYDDAIAVYKQALPIFRKLKQRNGEAQTLKDLGQAYSFKFEYAKAIDLYEQAWPIFHEIKDQNQEALTLQYLGDTYRALAKYDQAVESYNQALPIFRKLKNSWGEAYILKGLGFTSFSQAKYDEAISLYERALPIFQKAGDRNPEAYTRLEIGLSYASQQKYDKAITLYNQSRSIFQQIGERKGEAHALMNMGNAYRSRSQYSQAIALYQTALPIFQEVQDLEGTGFVLNNIGQLFNEQNQPELSIIFYKQSVKEREKIRAKISTLSRNLQESYTRSVAGTYRDLADLLLKQDRVLEAQQVLDLLKVQELDGYLQNVRSGQQPLIILRPEEEILKRYGELQKTAIQVGQELTELRKLDAKNALTPAQQKRLAQLTDLEKQINQQFNRFLEDKTITALVSQLTQITRNQNLNLEDLNALRDNLKSLNAVLLYPLILDDRLELVITTPNAPPIRRTVPNLKRQDLNRVIAEFRSTLEQRQPNVQKSAQQLYDWLIKPIEQDLAQAQAKTILYAPDDQLRYIPLAALHDGKQWLVERYQINNITARSVTDFTTPRQKQLQILAGAFGQQPRTVKLGDRFFPLTGLLFTLTEVKTLTSQLPGTIGLFEQNFSRATTLNRMNSFNVVHLATHGQFVVGKPEDSFIAFGNGDSIPLNEIKDLSLTNVDLVVLSACETGLGGLGNGVEILGMGYQFQRAGARAAIASLWTVDDGGTQALMNAFYDQLKLGQTKAEALQHAQTALINANRKTDSKQGRSSIEIEAINSGMTPEVVDRLSHPYYWAPFILIGNGL
jgi:CHAT domain-containing protein/tetratricopeptide (TPR) repeat protein